MRLLPAARKATEEGREETEEGTGSLAGAKEIHSCCGSGCFIIRTGRHFHTLRRTKNESGLLHLMANPDKIPKIPNTTFFLF